MRKLIPSIIVAVVAALTVASLATAQPSGGFSKTAPITGTGSNGSPLRLNAFGSCEAGSAVTAIGSNGALTCGAAGSTYTAGPGLLLTGDDFSVNAGTGLDITDDTLGVDIAGASCSPGQAVTAISSDGTGTCDEIDVNGQSSTSTGTINDFALNAGVTVLRFSGASAPTLNGLTGGATNRIIILVNVTGQTLPLVHEALTSTAANRFDLAGTLNHFLHTGSHVLLVYDATSLRWRASDDYLMNALSVGTNAQIGGDLLVGDDIDADGDVDFGNEDGDEARLFAVVKDASTAAAPTSCGSGAAITGGSWAFKIVTGSGATGCVATFATTKTNAPACTVTARSGTPPVYTVSATALTLTTAAASATYDVICIGDV